MDLLYVVPIIIALVVAVYFLKTRWWPMYKARLRVMEEPQQVQQQASNPAPQQPPIVTRARAVSNRIDTLFSREAEARKRDAENAKRTEELNDWESRLQQKEDELNEKAEQLRQKEDEQIEVENVLAVLNGEPTPTPPPEEKKITDDNGAITMMREILVIEPSDIGKLVVISSALKDYCQSSGANDVITPIIQLADEVVSTGDGLDQLKSKVRETMGTN